MFDHFVGLALKGLGESTINRSGQCYFFVPEKHHQTRDLQMFQGGIEMEHWAEWVDSAFTDFTNSFSFTAEVPIIHKPVSV